MPDNRINNQRAPSLRASAQHHSNDAKQSGNKPLGRLPGSPTEAHGGTARTPSDSSPKIRGVRNQVWGALEEGDMARFVILSQIYWRVAVRTLSDWNQEQKKLAKQNVDRDAREAAVAECEVELGHDPKSPGHFGDNSGDYIIEPIKEYGE